MFKTAAAELSAEHDRDAHLPTRVASKETLRKRSMAGIESLRIEDRARHPAGSESCAEARYLVGNLVYRMWTMG